MIAPDIFSINIFPYVQTYISIHRTKNLK